jgi:multidrug resistance protein MdtO
VLRMGGAIVGGFLIALPAQVYLLPYLDSITAFLLFFAAVNGLAAWIATSSPRLAYFGLQIALAFDLVNLGEFAFQTSLAVARDRVVGVLVGLVAMWIAFESFGAQRARDSMLRLLEQVTQDLAALAGVVARLDAGTEQDRRAALPEAWNLRDRINSAFTAMNDQADAIQFETGPSRTRNLFALEKMAALQPSLRTVYLLEIALGQLRASVAEQPLADRGAFQRFQAAVGGLLRDSAARVHLYAEGVVPTDDLEDALLRVKGTLVHLEREGLAAATPLAQELTRALEILVGAQTGATESSAHAGVGAPVPAA